MCLTNFLLIAIAITILLLSTHFKNISHVFRCSYSILGLFIGFVGLFSVIFN